MIGKALRRIVRELVPPILLRPFRTKGGVPVTTVAQASEHVVRSGPFKGGRLFVDTTRPAFHEMVDGSYDAYLWNALPGRMEGAVVLDIGAHIGYHALALANQYPAMQVVAFEPNPANLERFHVNLVLNGGVAERIQVMPYALGSSVGVATFQSSAMVDDQTSSGGYLGGVDPPLEKAIYDRSGFTASEVQVRRLDDLARDFGWGRVAFMKIDVEGAEHLVLEGGTEVLRRDRPLLCVEIHSVACMLRVATILQPLGYSIELLKEDRPSRAHILAR